MEALKKAEQEKKEAAQRLRASEARLEARADKAVIAAAEGSATEGEGAEVVGPRSEPPPQSLKLEPIDQQQTSPDAAALDDKTQAKRSEQGGATPAPVEPISKAHTDLSADDTFHGVALGTSPSVGDNPELLEATLQGEKYAGEDERISIDDTSPGVPIAQMEYDGGKDPLTPVAAQTVFTASGRGALTSWFHWPLYAALGLLIVIAIAVLINLLVTPVTRELPSPRVARGIEQTPVPVMGLATPPPPDNNIGPGCNPRAGAINGSER